MKLFFGLALLGAFAAVLFGPLRAMIGGDEPQVINTAAAQPAPTPAPAPATVAKQNTPRTVAYPNSDRDRRVSARQAVGGSTPGGARSMKKNEGNSPGAKAWNDNRKKWGWPEKGTMLDQPAR